MTRAQLKPFFRAVSRAASAQGLVGREAVEAYRRKVMREEAGTDHAADVDPGTGYDRVMYRLAVDAGDWAAAARFATGEERRLAALVEGCARQVVELKAVEDECPFGGDPDDPRGEAIAYVVGIMQQAGFRVVSAGEGWWMDISAQIAFTVFRILDTHRRRILRRLGWRGRMAFDIEASWVGEIDRVGVRKAESNAPCPIRVGRPPDAA